MQFGLVAYRDHPPQDHTYVTRVFDFITDSAGMTNNLSSLSAEGGGDGPEALTAGLHAAKNLTWRDGAAKVVVLIADAPPHGLGEGGDGFPDGDPDGLDPLVIAREMSNLGIAIYSVGCEPALGSYKFARSFMISLSEITGGKAVSLSSAALLAEVILGGALEELNIQTLANQLQPEIEAIRSEIRSISTVGGVGLSDEEQESAVIDRVHHVLVTRGVKMSEMQTDGEMKDDTISPKLRACLNLADVRQVLSKEVSTAPPPLVAMFAARSPFGLAKSPDTGVFNFGGAPATRGAYFPPAVPGKLLPISATSATRCEVIRESPSLSSVSKMISKSRGKF